MKTYTYNQIVRRKVGPITAAGIAILSIAVSPPDRAQSREVKSFCEYGTATALQIGAGGAIWEQEWGAPAFDWFNCTAEPNIGFLNEDVVGLQTTRTTGAPAIDANLVLTLPFAGSITLTAIDPDNPDAVAGEITGTMAGSFVADLNAAHAIVTDTTITVDFGSPLHAGPDALITVTETTGKFKSIEAMDPWEWHVSGTLTLARVPALPVQLNIFAALQNSALILAAEEDVVLSGSYERTQPTH
jgi:hypothetical protein